MWEIMRKKCLILKFRSWESLKERFRKHIMNNIEKYSLDPEVVEKFKSKFILVVQIFLYNRQIIAFITFIT